MTRRNWRNVIYWMVVTALIFLFLQVRSVYAHEVIVSWNPSASVLTDPSIGYNLYRSVEPGQEDNTTAINAAPIAVGCTTNATCTYIDLAIIPGWTYCYVIRAIRTNPAPNVFHGESADSNEACGTVPVDYPGSVGILLDKLGIGGYKPPPPPVIDSSTKPQTGSKP